MKTILIITNIWRHQNSSKKVTNVVNTYYEVLTAAGHNVKVLQLRLRYPLIELFLRFSFLSKWLENHLSLVIDRPREKDILVESLTVTRLTPYHAIRKTDQARFHNDLVNLRNDGFIPNSVVLHWLWPGIALEGVIRNVWPTTRLNIVVHGKKYLSHLKLSPNIGNIFFRNAGLSRAFGQKVGGLLYPSPISDIFFLKSESNISMSRTYDLLVVGNLLRRKNVKIVVEVASILNLKLLIIGEGPEEQQLQAQIDRLNVDARILPWCSQEDLKVYYQSSRILALPSVNEAFGLVYFEAMSQGCVPIGLRGEGADGHILNGKEGLLIDEASPLNLKTAIERILKDFDSFSENAFIGGRRFSRLYFTEWFARHILNKV